MSSSLPNKESSSRIVYLLTCVFLFCLCFLVYWQIQRLYITFGPPAFGDLRRFWAAGNLLSNGENPYDLRLLSEYAIKHGAGDLSLYLPFYYPAFSMVGLLPFALFSFDQTRLIYIWGTSFAITIMLGLPVLRNLLIVLRQGKHITYELVAAAARWSFFPVLLFLWNGAITFFPFLGLALFLLIEKHSRSTSGAIIQGLALSMTLMKPSVCYLALIFVVARWFRNRSYLSLTALSLGFTTLWFISRLYLSSIPISASTEGVSALEWATPTLVAMIQQYVSLPPYTRLIPSIIALIVAAFFGYYSSAQKNIRLALCCVWIPASLVFVPYAWTYDFIMLAFTICYVLNNVVNEVTTTKDVFYPLTIFLSNLGLLILPIAMHLHWWYPVVFLMFGVKYFLENNLKYIK